VNRIQRFCRDSDSTSDMALRAYDRALSALKNHSKEAGQEAITLAKQVIAMDPRCRSGYAAIAESHLVEALFDWTPSANSGLARAQEAAEKLRDQDRGDHTAYLFLGRVAFMRKQHDLAGMNLNRALDLNPNDVSALCHLAWLEGSSGLPDAAKDHAELALQLNPQDPFTRFFAHWNLAQVAFVTGNYHAGAEYAQHSLIDMPHHVGNLGMLTACLAETRELTRARAVIKEAMRFGPSYVKYKLRGNSYFKQEADHDRYIGALRKAAGDLQF
jgi:tetratricopeptide (TPR) repeat protein